MSLGISLSWSLVIETLINCTRPLDSRKSPLVFVVQPLQLQFQISPPLFLVPRHFLLQMDQIHHNHTIKDLRQGRGQRNLLRKGGLIMIYCKEEEVLLSPNEVHHTPSHAQLPTAPPAQPPSENTRGTLLSGSSL